MGYKARLTDCAARVTSQPRGWPIRKAPAKRYAVLSGRAARLVGLAAQLLAGAPRCRPRVGKVKYVCFADNRVDPIVRRNDRTQRRLGEGNRRRTGAGWALGWALGLIVATALLAACGIRPVLWRPAAVGQVVEYQGAVPADFQSRLAKVPPHSLIALPNGYGSGTRRCMGHLRELSLE